MYRSRHMQLVTDLNMTLKAGQRDSLVWVTDLATGRPVPGLEVILFEEDDGSQLGIVTTDNNGIARLDLGKPPYRTSIVAAVLPSATQARFSAVAENWSRGISPYEFGIDLAYDFPEFTTHIYTDRPIYRPGQVVYFKGVIRAQDDVNYRLPDIGRVQLNIRDAAYETVLDQEVTLSSSGTFNGEFKLEQGATLGNYVIGINFADQYAEQYFQVAAYRPPEFEVVVEPESPELLRGSDVEATIKTSYFFGGPLAGADVDWSVLAESYRFRPTQLGNYSFDDQDDPYTCFDCWWWYTPPSPEPVMNGSGTTGADGSLPLTLDGTELDENLPRGSHRLIIEATATGPDNQFISGRDSVIVHKGEYYIGLRDGKPVGISASPPDD